MWSKISTRPVATVFKGGKASLMRATILNDSFTTWIAVSPTFPVFSWLTGTIVGGGGRSGVLQEPRTGWSICAGNWGTAYSENDWWSVRLSGTDDGWLVGERLRKILRNLSLNLFRGVWGFKDINDSPEGSRDSEKAEGWNIEGVNDHWRRLPFDWRKYSLHRFISCLSRLFEIVCGDRILQKKHAKFMTLFFSRRPEIVVISWTKMNQG